MVAGMRQKFLHRCCIPGARLLSDLLQCTKDFSLLLHKTFVPAIGFSGTMPYAQQALP